MRAPASPSGAGAALDLGAAAAGADGAVVGGADGGDGGEAADGGSPRYDSDGPEPYQQIALTAMGNGRSIPLTIYLPATSGARPVVMLSAGLQQPAAAYAPYGKRLASWGIIAILRDDPGVLEQSQAVADDIAFVIATWLPMQNVAPSGALAGRVDVGRVGLAGHSRGGMASLLAAEGALRGKLSGFFGLDPVDNGGAAAMALGSIAVPSVLLGETTDGSAGGGMACAPTDQNYDVLYEAAPAPSLEITALGADHTQFEDPASCSFCTLCTKGSADGANVLRYSTRYLMAFFARVLLGDATVGTTLGGAGLDADVASGLVTSQSK